MNSITNKTDSIDFVSTERERIRVEYDRRAREIDPDRYASWQPSEQFTIANRNRSALTMLKHAHALPLNGECLEVGCGSGGWLGELKNWGVDEEHLHGIDLDAERARQARANFPPAEIRIGDAVELPWSAGTFQLVIASTLFTSVLDSRVRQLIANEIQRVLAPGGVLLWYDFAYNNPRNPNVRGIKRSEIRSLFPTLDGQIRSVTLGPPLARLLAPKSRRLAQLLEAVPPLRTHLMAVLVKASNGCP